MTLPAGTRLGPYEIQSPLGAGGMGEVYRARDSRLGRDVAVKVLPAAFASDPVRLRRFEKEARSASALNHPNVVTILDFGSSESVSYIAMELVDGQSLRAVLLKGALPFRKLFQIGVQVADGLAKAHAAGIVHRDLKPENVMVTNDGLVKILDFGLAKLMQPEDRSGVVALEPTVSEGTAPGFAAGTAGYMSPEQALGESVDFRSDQFSFGAVLYEMATGRRAFHRGSAPETLTAVIREEPEPIAALKPGFPAPVRWIVERCLAKDPENRFASTEDLARDLATIRDHLPEVTSGVALAAFRPRRRWIPRLVLGAAALVIAAMVLLRPRPPAAELRAVRFFLRRPPGAEFSQGGYRSYGFSPDGSQFAFRAVSPGSAPKIWLRPLSAAQAQVLPGTENAGSLFWSPDGRFVAFFATGKLWRLDLSGGVPAPICDVDANLSYAGTWGAGGQILFAPRQGDAIYRVSTSGGAPATIVKPDRAHGETTVTWPWFLPDGKSFLYLRQKDEGGILMLSSLDGTGRLLFPMSSRVEYVDPGYLVFVRDGTLMAQRFDPRSGNLSGEPLSIADSLHYRLANGWADFATSRNGALAFGTVPAPTGHLALFDRAGKVEMLGATAGYGDVAIDPDGRRVLFDRAQGKSGIRNLWILDLETKVETRVTADPTDEFQGIWFPDGKSIVYTAEIGGREQLRRRDLATGRVQALLPEGVFQEAGAVLPGGEQLVYTQKSDRGTDETKLVSLSGDQKSSALFQTGFDKAGITSPDGRFIAFFACEPECVPYVAPIANTAERVRIPDGGYGRWSRDGSGIFLWRERQMIFAPIRTAPALSVGKPSVLFTLKEGTNSEFFDVSPDGKTFLAVVSEGAADEYSLNVILNWTAESTQGGPAR